MDRKAALLDAEARRCQAMLANDPKALEGLLDARLHFSHANGAVDDKAAYLAKIEAGRILYRAIDWSGQKVIELGETALLTGRMTSEVRVEGNERRLDNRVLSAWAWGDGGWKLVAFQSTPLPQG